MRDASCEQLIGNPQFPIALDHSRWGINIKAIGENPHSIDGSAGRCISHPPLATIDWVVHHH
jgi:hypothetical protein